MDKYPVRRLGAFSEAVAVVNRALPLGSSGWRTFYDQGEEGACVGFSCSWMMSVRNRRRYAARWLWDRAKERDEWADTNPGDNEGTSVRAACDVLRDVGHCRMRGDFCWPADMAEGIEANRWATSVDELRTAVHLGNPVTLGVNWYRNFDAPRIGAGGRHWIGKGELGRVRGGHAICLYAAFDRWQAFGLVNSWGKSYPLVLIPYETAQRLLDEDGEAALITDR